MLPDTYVKRNGCIYGHRSRYNGNGIWIHEFERFTELDKAIAWKKESDYGYKRELLSKSNVKKHGVKLDEKGKIIA